MDDETAEIELVNFLKIVAPRLISNLYLSSTRI